ncbi:hypothetical protein V8E36_005403 [Tilletia maclaganii]
MPPPAFCPGPGLPSRPEKEKGFDRSASHETSTTLSPHTRTAGDFPHDVARNHRESCFQVCTCLVSYASVLTVASPGIASRAATSQHLLYSRRPRAQRPKSKRGRENSEISNLCRRFHCSPGFLGRRLPASNNLFQRQQSPLRPVGSRGEKQRSMRRRVDRAPLPRVQRVPARRPTRHSTRQDLLYVASTLQASTFNPKRHPRAPRQATVSTHRVILLPAGYLSTANSTACTNQRDDIR